MKKHSMQQVAQHTKMIKEQNEVLRTIVTTRSDPKLFIAHDAYILMCESFADHDGFQTALDYDRASEYMRYGYPL